MERPAWLCFLLPSIQRRKHGSEQATNAKLGILAKAHGVTPRIIHEAKDEVGSMAGYYFAIDEGILRKKLIPLRAVVSIGRAPENDIRFSDRYVSKQHALVSLIGGEYVIQDVGSRNGVFINGKRVKTAVLRSGDTLQLGNTILRFIYKEERKTAKAES
jgi:hypothetical protein